MIRIYPAGFKKFNKDFKKKSNKQILIYVGKDKGGGGKKIPQDKISH